MSATRVLSGAIVIEFTRAIANFLDVLKLNLPTLFVASRTTPRSMALTHGMGPGNECRYGMIKQIVYVELPHCLAGEFEKLTSVTKSVHKQLRKATLLTFEIAAGFIFLLGSNTVFPSKLRRGISAVSNKLLCATTTGFGAF